MPLGQILTAGKKIINNFLTTIKKKKKVSVTEMLGTAALVRLDCSELNIFGHSKISPC